MRAACASRHACSSAQHGSFAGGGDGGDGGDGGGGGGAGQGLPRLVYARGSLFQSPWILLPWEPYVVPRVPTLTTGPQTLGLPNT